MRNKRHTNVPETPKDSRAEESKETKERAKWKEKDERRGRGRRKKKSRTKDDTLTRLEEIVFLCRDSHHTLQRTLAAGNKLPLEISESLLRGAPRSSSREEQFYCISKPVPRQRPGGTGWTGRE